jgi:hypothetical protein
MFDQIEARFFAYQFDFEPKDMQDSDQLTVAFSQGAGSGEENSKEYHFVINSFQQDSFSWELTSESRQDGSDQAVIASGEYEDPGFSNSQHHLGLFVFQERLLVLLDQKVAAYYSGLDLAQSGVRVHTYFDQPGPHMQFDDFQFWNLDGVEINL